MFKKIAIFGAAGLLTAAVLTQTSVGKHFRSWMHRAETALEERLSPEEQLRQIKEDVSKLDKDIEKAKGDLAFETVEVRHLKKEVEEMKSAVEASRKAIEAKGQNLKDASDAKLVKWEGKEISFSDAKNKLAAEVKAQKNRETTLKNKETMLAVRERTRKLADDHLVALVSQKSELEAAVTEMDAEIKLAKIEQVESKYQNDGTRMSDVKKSLASLRKKIEVQRELTSLTQKIDPSSVENKSVEDILAELDNKANVVNK